MIKIEPETWKQRTKDRDKTGGGGGSQGKEGEGANRGTQRADSWAWTMGGLTVGVLGDRVGASNGGKVEATVTEQK